MSNDIYADKIIPVSSRKISIDAGLNITGDAAISGSLTATNPETGTSGSLVFSSDFTKCLGSSISGLALSNGTDTEHDITIASGYCIDSTGTYVLRLTSPITKQLDAAWTNGTNAGGMQTGSSISATTEYFVWLIRRDSDGYVDAIGSPSMTSPTLPAGYTYKRLLRGVRTNASSNIVNNQWLITDVNNDRTANLVVHDEQPQNTGGTVYATGAWRTIVINTIKINEIPGASLSSNQVTLPAGQYIVRGSAGFFSGSSGFSFMTRLYNITLSAAVEYGMSQGGGAGMEWQGLFTIFFTLSTTTVLEIQVQASYGVAGYQSNYSVEKYLTAHFTKVG